MLFRGVFHALQFIIVFYLLLVQLNIKSSYITSNQQFKTDNYALIRTTIKLFCLLILIGFLILPVLRNKMYRLRQVLWSKIIYCFNYSYFPYCIVHGIVKLNNILQWHQSCLILVLCITVCYSIVKLFISSYSLQYNHKDEVSLRAVLVFKMMYEFKVFQSH